MTTEEKQEILKVATQTAAQALYASFVLCDLKDKIATTIDFEDATGETHRFKLSFEKIVTG